MTPNQRAHWARQRRRGSIRYVLLTALGVTAAFFVFDALLGTGYTLLVKQRNWEAYVQALNGRSLLVRGLFVGTVIGLYNWRRNEKAFHQTT